VQEQQQQQQQQQQGQQQQGQQQQGQGQGQQQPPMGGQNALRSMASPPPQYYAPQHDQQHDQAQYDGGQQYGAVAEVGVSAEDSVRIIGGDSGGVGVPGRAGGAVRSLSMAPPFDNADITDTLLLSRGGSRGASQASQGEVPQEEIQEAMWVERQRETGGGAGGKTVGETVGNTAGDTAGETAAEGEARSEMEQDDLVDMAAWKEKVKTRGARRGGGGGGKCVIERVE
jgi:hypothetical protein